MSEFKGTKGKWVVYREIMIVTKEQSIGDVICLIPESKESRLNWEANAKLMSFAPEILEMLEKIMSNYDKGTQTYIECQELIKKATKL